METITSADGTTIAYERTGRGPAVILVDGAMCYRGAGPMGPLAALLKDTFTVYTYDRRGRGQSSDTLPYAVDREIEDLQALLAVAGGAVGAYGMSSGGALVLAAAASGPGIGRIALYEPPFLAERGDGERAAAYTAQLEALLADGRRGDAIALFMTFVGVPAAVVAGMRTQPGWERFEAIAPTLAYDDRVLAGGTVPHRLAATITVPALVVAGGASPQNLRDAARATAEALPAGALAVLDGQTHDVEADALAPLLLTFFGA